MKRASLGLGLLGVALLSCGGESDSPAVPSVTDAGGDSAEASGDCSLCDAAGEGTEAEAAPPQRASTYGLFQLYGDEYTEFRQQMGMSREDYWSFVDKHVAELRVSFTRTNTLLIWGIVEPTLGQGYVWDGPTNTDAVVKATYAAAQGKEMDILLVVEPGRGKQDTPPYPTGLENEYQQYVRTVVERYDGDGNGDVAAGVRVKHWQVMNEPFFQLDQGKLSEDQYASLVKLTAAAVRDADPEAKIVLGDVGGHLSAILPKLAQGKYFEAIDIHYWSSGNNYRLGVLDKVRNSLDTNGYSAAEIWMCEFGSPRNVTVGPSAPQSAADQARWLVKALVANRAAGVARLLWNNLVGWSNFNGDPKSQFNFMGLISSGASSGDDPSLLGKETLAYYAFQRLLRETDTPVADLTGQEPGVPAGVSAFRYQPKAGGNPFYIAWTDQNSQTATFGCPSPTATLVKLMPNEQGVFEEQSLTASNNLVTVDVGVDPILVQPQQ